ncbi:MAG: N-acetyltransferase family protein [Solirubrobacteraceae bacterium]
MPLGPATAITVRRAQPQDLDRLIALTVAEGDDRELTQRRLYADLETEGRELFLATADRQPAGYGRTCRFEHDAGAPANVAPDGYYLSGILVASSWRRRGIGERSRAGSACSRGPGAKSRVCSTTHESRARLQPEAGIERDRSIEVTHDHRHLIEAHTGRLDTKTVRGSCSRTR